MIIYKYSKSLNNGIQYLPLLASSSANALPIPEFPPVIITTKPSNLAGHVQILPEKNLLKLYHL